MIKNTYLFFVTLPERLYPFASEVEGQWVRGRRSYDLALSRALQTYGLNRLGYKLTLYREVFHFIGSIFFIVLAAAISKEFFDTSTALYFLLGSAVIALCFQEFYLHPRLYGQHLAKGLTDTLVWLVPIASYVFLIK